jgi:hypothetical protein
VAQRQNIAAGAPDHDLRLVEGLAFEDAWTVHDHLEHSPGFQVITAIRRRINIVGG